MIEAQAVIVNARGMHARPSAKLVKLASAYQSTLTIYKGKRKADAKSMAGLLMLAASAGSELRIVAEGIDEKEAAAALIELIAGGFSDDAVPNNPQKPEAVAKEKTDGKQVHKISGIGVGEAVVSGKAHIYSSAKNEVKRYRITKAQVAAEIRRYEKALQLVRRECELLKQQTEDHFDSASEITPFIDLNLMLLADKEFSQKPQAMIRKRLINAEWALKERVEIMADDFRRLPDAYLRERYHDIEQVMHRVLAAMEATAAKRRSEIDKGDNALLVAEELAPADVIRLSQLGYKGFIAESGSANSHTAILARSMNIPALVGARGILSCVCHNDTVMLDTLQQIAIINPSAADIKKHRQQERKKSGARRRQKSRGKGISSLDGEQVFLQTNIELPDETTAAVHCGADGIGLFRTEFLFMDRPDLPEEDEQFEIYRQVLKRLHPLPVTIRTLDIGGDKMPPSVESVPIGANPALGVRAIRYCLLLPDLFMTQLRALLRAYAEYDNLRILFPMVAHPHELERTLKLLAAAAEQLRATQGLELQTPPIGAMIEIPAAVFIMRQLAKSLNFFSIGTNDLIQYTMAMDRNNEMLVSLCDPLHPAVLRLLAEIVTNAARAKLPLTLCGELAGDAELTPLVLGLGLRRLSMTSAMVETVRARVQASDCGAYVRMVRHVLRAPTPEAARALITEANGGG